MGQKLRKKQLADRYGHSVRTIERWWHDPALGFPQPFFIGRNPLWELDEIEAWEKSRRPRQPALTLDDLDIPREAAE
jgi:predicted DNA-binding transcriptional regulator AlpA